ACARVLICLLEKGVPFTGHYVDVLALEQHSKEFVDLNASAQVPVLVHREAVYTEASLIGEYLEEAFPQPPLLPAETHGRWEVRAWQKYVDDHCSPALSELAWQRWGNRMLRDHARTDVPAAIARLSVRERRDAWAEALRGFSEERIERARERASEAVRRVER